MRNYWFLLLVLVILSGCASFTPLGDKIEWSPSAVNDNLQEALPPEEFDNLGPAPEITSEVWLNTAKPLRLVDLRGKVILLEMWTFG